VAIKVWGFECSYQLRQHDPQVDAVGVHDGVALQGLVEHGRRDNLGVHAGDGPDTGQLEHLGAALAAEGVAVALGFEEVGEGEGVHADGVEGPPGFGAVGAKDVGLLVRVVVGAHSHAGVAWLAEPALPPVNCLAREDGGGHLVLELEVAVRERGVVRGAGQGAVGRCTEWRAGGGRGLAGVELHALGVLDQVDLGVDARDEAVVLGLSLNDAYTHITCYSRSTSVDEPKRYWQESSLVFLLQSVIAERSQPALLRAVLVLGGNPTSRQQRLNWPLTMKLEIRLNSCGVFLMGSIGPKACDLLRQCRRGVSVGPGACGRSVQQLLLLCSGGAW
jgi:hypothetical protein